MNRAVLIQSLKQMWGIILLEYRYHGNLPDIETYCSAVQYSLPFEGKWVVVNGGVTKEISHSWEIPTQRYAYDFLILDEKGNSLREKKPHQNLFIVMGKIYFLRRKGLLWKLVQNALIAKLRRKEKLSVPDMISEEITF